jgi:hypothetical protein
VIDPRRAGRGLIHAITDLTWAGDRMNKHPIVFMSGYGQKSLLSALMLQMDRSLVRAVRGSTISDLDRATIIHTAGGWW